MPRRIGLKASPLSFKSRCGTPRSATPLRKTSTADLAFSVLATREATASREWSSRSWQITHLRPPSSRYSVVPNCRRYEIPGLGVSVTKFRFSKHLARILSVERIVVVVLRPWAKPFISVIFINRTRVCFETSWNPLRCSQAGIFRRP